MRRVFRDRPFRSFILLNTLFIAASIALFSELFPVFAKNEAAVSEREIGLIFFLNTALIVIVQLPVAKWQQGKRRMSALAAMAVLFAVTWVLVLFGGLTLEAGARDRALCVCLRDLLARRVPARDGAGPARLGSGAPPLLGRYMAMSSSSWQVGFIIGPAVGGFVLQAQPYALWPVAAAVCLVGASGRSRSSAGCRRPCGGRRWRRAARSCASV